MKTIKNVHSPAGMNYTTINVRHTTLIDCPGCKFGTIDEGKNGRWKCADCQRTYSAKQLKELKVIP